MGNFKRRPTMLGYGLLVAIILIPFQNCSKSNLNSQKSEFSSSAQSAAAGQSGVGSIAAGGSTQGGSTGIVVNPGSGSSTTTGTTTTTVLDKDDALTWMNSQLPDKTHVTVHAEKWGCDDNKAIKNYYAKAFNRTPQQSEINYYLNLRTQGATFKTIRGYFASSPEFLNLSLSANDFIVRLYRILFLREPSASEISYHAPNFSTIGKSGLVNLFKSSAEFINMTSDCAAADMGWVTVANFSQPFKSMVETSRNIAYWRKDSPDNYYGEVYTYDSVGIYLKSETFPYFHGVDAANSWDARADKTREFTTLGQNYLSSKGRLVAKRKISTSGITTADVSTYMCYSAAEYKNSQCRNFQSKVSDRIYLTKSTGFSTVFDGEHSDATWAANAEFKSFDEVLVWNQEMNGTAGRERFFFGYKNGVYYGIVRWDNSLWENGAWKVTERTVGLRKDTAAWFSFDGIKARGAMIAPYIQ